MEKKLLQDVLSKWPPLDSGKAQAALAAALGGQNRVIVVLDDDPTGVQTVHDIAVYTNWETGSIDRGFDEGGMFFILTNSRGMSAADAKEVNRLIAQRVMAASRKYGKEFILISRSDSTLRGYYPLETATLRETVEAGGDYRLDGEIICPFFVEGGRYTAEDVHYVAYGEELVPAGDTEFAGDKSFGYKSSNLREWVEEKTGGAYKKEDVKSISLDMLRGDNGADAVCDLLAAGSGFCKVVLNALSYDDIRVFCTGYIKACQKGKNYLFRSGAAIPKILGGVTDKPLLGREELVVDNRNGGLVVIGSHVAKTTRQMEELRGVAGVEFIEFDQHLVLNPAEFEGEIKRVKGKMHEKISAGKDTVVFTRRQRLDMGGDPEEELSLSRKISDAITSFVTDLAVQPAYIIAKGGITSSDIGTVGLGARRAMVMGQVLPGIPVWKIGEESKFPGMAYVIFPGNVGGEDALRVIVEKLRANR